MNKIILVSLLFNALMVMGVPDTHRYITKVRYDEDSHEHGRAHKDDDTIIYEFIGDQKPQQKADHGVFSPAFSAIGGDITHVSSRGKEVWAIKKDESIHRFKDGAWKKMPGGAVNVGATEDGHAWVVNRADQIYRFNTHIQNWHGIPGGLIQISAHSKDEAIGANRAKEVYLWRHGGWSMVPKGAGKGLDKGAIWASLGAHDERWAIGPDNGIWRWDNHGHKWVVQPGGADTVDVYNSTRVVVTNSANVAYTWVASKNTWQPLAGKVAKRATIGEDHLITLGTDGYLSVTKL